MALKIKSLSKVVGIGGLKILIHGKAGAGKTTLFATTADTVLLVSAESGLLSLQDVPKKIQDRIKVTEVTSLGELEEIHEALVSYAEEDPDNLPFKWIGLDSITEIAEAFLSKAKSEAKDPRQAYGMVQDEIGKILRSFRDLASYGYNVVMSCKMERIKDEEIGRFIFMPMMPGTKLGQSIPYLFDEVFALRVEKGEDGADYRVLQTSADANYEAKDRSGRLDKFEKPSLRHIEKKIKGELVEEEPAVVEAPAVEAAVVDPEETSTNVAKKDMYFYHTGADEYFMVQKGDELPDDPEVTEVPKKQYAMATATAKTEEATEE